MDCPAAAEIIGITLAVAAVVTLIMFPDLGESREQGEGPRRLAEKSYPAVGVRGGPPASAADPDGTHQRSM